MSALARSATATFSSISEGAAAGAGDVAKGPAAGGAVAGSGTGDAETGALPTLLVAAAVVVEEGRVLLTQRKAGTHLAGAWEFPGGKVRAGEDPRDALVRELDEELGIETVIGDIMEVTFHRYPERSVLLLFYGAARTPRSAEPRALDVAAFRWARDEELDETSFPPADVAILRKVRARLAAGG